MSVVLHKRGDRYRGGKTLNVPKNDGSGLLSRAECSSLLGIKSRVTVLDYFNVLGFKGLHYLTWEQVREILSLQAFLGIKPGENSKQMYLNLRDRNLIPKIFHQYGINIEVKLQKVQNDYQQQRSKSHE